MKSEAKNLLLSCCNMLEKYYNELEDFKENVLIAKIQDRSINTE